MNKIVVIVGSTASGKSELAVKLAKKFGGEIVSADSRQVYRGLDIGSGKITRVQMQRVPHHLLDVVSPRRTFTVVQYQRRAIQAIASIHRRKKLPILVGGSPFYIYAVVDGYVFPEVKPTKKLRRSLDRLSNQELLEKLQKLDAERANALQETSGEAKNKRRLIRALEIILSTGKPVPKLKRITPLFDILILGIKRFPKELRERIRHRLMARLSEGMVKEVKELRKSGLSWQRLENFGLEYRNVAQYLQGKVSYEDMLLQLKRAINDFARRQISWFKRDSRIHWIESQNQAEQLVRNFLCV